VGTGVGVGVGVGVEVGVGLGVATSVAASVAVTELAGTGVAARESVGLAVDVADVVGPGVGKDADGPTATADAPPEPHAVKRSTAASSIATILDQLGRLRPRAVFIVCRPPIPVPGARRPSLCRAGRETDGFTES